jgi:hypothetical protein
LSTSIDESVETLGHRLGVTNQNRLAAMATALLDEDREMVWLACDQLSRELRTFPPLAVVQQRISEFQAKAELRSRQLAMIQDTKLFTRYRGQRGDPNARPSREELRGMAERAKYTDWIEVERREVRKAFESRILGYATEAEVARVNNTEPDYGLDEEELAIVRKGYRLLKRKHMNQIQAQRRDPQVDELLDRCAADFAELRKARQSEMNFEPVELADPFAGVEDPGVPF